MYQRGINGRYYIEDNVTGKQESLGTSDRTEALRLFHARNEAEYQPAFNAQMARVYLVAKDALISKRTWQFVMDEMKRTKVKHAERTSERYESAFNEEPFDALRHLILIETRPDAILKVLLTGTVSTNIFMRRLHSFALNMGWLPWPIIAYAQWPRLKYKTRRAITADEAQRLLDIEPHPEWKAFLQLLWHTGLEQSFAEDRSRALIHMATGAGKTYTACAFTYRLIKYAKARRVLFLVDRANLGEQARDEFHRFRTPDTGRLFTELYNVQHLTSPQIDDVCRVTICTIQRLYSILRGEELAEDARAKTRFGHAELTA